MSDPSVNTKRKTRTRTSKLTALIAYDLALLTEYRESTFPDLKGLIGVDEVGRGSLIGPVVAGAMVFPLDADPALHRLCEDLDDSKAAHFTHEKRLKLADTLKSFCCWGLGEASLEEIEALNIYHASLLASRRAIEDLQARFADCLSEQYLVVLDGKVTLKDYTGPNIARIKVDGLSAAVAGASVIAKAYRDAMVIALAETYPGYGWERNAGYGTPEHQRALQTQGITPYHRKTYKYVQEALTQQMGLALKV